MGLFGKNKKSAEEKSTKKEEKKKQKEEAKKQQQEIDKEAAELKKADSEFQKFKVKANKMKATANIYLKKASAKYNIVKNYIGKNIRNRANSLSQLKDKGMNIKKEEQDFLNTYESMKPEIKQTESDISEYYNLINSLVNNCKQYGDNNRGKLEQAKKKLESSSRLLKSHRIKKVNHYVSKLEYIESVKNDLEDIQSEIKAIDESLRTKG